MVSEKYKILIVEDDNFLLNMYATKFELDGFEVFLADDGEKALRLAQKELPDAILLDVLIPKMNGFEVLKVLKSMDKTSDIKVLLLTNLSQRDEVEHGLEGGAVDYLIKAHFMPSEVVDKVKKMIAN
jgi:DNA-binding response OmpR family regulator